MPCRAMKDGLETVENSDKMLSFGEGKWKTTSVFFENSMNNMKNQKDRILKDELSRLVGALYTSGNQ